jgi:hypothetical protein
MFTAGKINEKKHLLYHEHGNIVFRKEKKAATLARHISTSTVF